MRLGGLTAADWQVLTEYLAVLKPLLLATKCLEGRGKAGKYGAIYEVLPIYEYLLPEYEQLATMYEAVDYNAHDAPENHLAINLRAAVNKLKKYYNKLDESPYYFIATLLHPYYKTYCEVSWRDNRLRFERAMAAFRRIWAGYKPATEPVQAARSSGNTIDDAIEALMSQEVSDVPGAEVHNEYDHWRQFEPRWQREYYEDKKSESPVKYWQRLQSRYPNLSQLAIDVLTIPASSSDCERMFTDLGDLLEPKRRKLGAELLAALKCVKEWQKYGIKTPAIAETERYTDADIDAEFGLLDWGTIAS
jgi:hypothetical protein